MPLKKPRVCHPRKNPVFVALLHRVALTPRPSLDPELAKLVYHWGQDLVQNTASRIVQSSNGLKPSTVPVPKITTVGSSTQFKQSSRMSWLVAFVFRFGFEFVFVSWLFR